MKIGITERGDAARHFKKWIVKLDSVDGVIAITKDPLSLYKKLKKYKIPADKLIVHCTITGFGASPLEPHVPNYKDALKGHKKFVSWLGPAKTVLRVDPIFPTERGLVKAKRVLGQAAGSRVRISFLDLYNHIKGRFSQLEKEDSVYYLEDLISVYELGKIHAPLWYRKRLVKYFQKYTSSLLEICGEPGFTCLGCVSKDDLKALNLKYDANVIGKQRAACTCLALKTELLDRRKPCKHGCLYCYWQG